MLCCTAAPHSASKAPRALPAYEKELCAVHPAKKTGAPAVIEKEGTANDRGIHDEDWRYVCPISLAASGSLARLAFFLRNIVRAHGGAASVLIRENSSHTSRTRSFAHANDR
jgi:hypothetical protein